MTPTEQDNELHSKSYKLAQEYLSTGSLEGFVDLIQNNLTLDEALQLIAADRKRVELEARIETVMYIDSMLRFENIPLHPVQSASLKQYLRQLEAQQEEKK